MTLVKWFKKFVLIASVYSLSAAGIYFSILPTSNDSWDRETALTQALWLAIPLMILVTFIWNKISKKFDL
ncbi:MAG: hypothetical protein AAB948_01850 [Patescibacteria group bacterium]